MSGIFVRGTAGAATRAAWRPTTQVPRRGLAAHADEPVVTWQEYRSGKATLAEWVDGNRHLVAFGFFVFYVGLGVNAMRPKKNKKKADEADAATEPAAAPAK